MATVYMHYEKDLVKLRAEVFQSGIVDGEGDSGALFAFAGATRRAAATLAPEENPAKMPSLLASSLG